MRQTVIVGIRALAGSLACALLWPAEAHAQVAYNWYPTKTGCQVWGDEYDLGPGFTWTGKCNANNHIEGNGSLAYFSEEGKKNVEFVGEFIDGRPHGPFQYNAFVGDDAWPSPYHKVRFDMGCRVSDSREADPACRAASGVGKVAAGPAAPAKVAAASAAPVKITANDPGFQSNLKTYAADQLLSLAQEFIQSGEIDLAKLARNALLQRFPDSPLVPVVAELIANEPATIEKDTTAYTTEPTNTSNGSRPAGQRVHIANVSQLIDAFARVGVTMNPEAGSTTAARESTNAYLAYVSDCRDGECRGIQLLAPHLFATLPSYNLVQSWNLDRLYGRAYISGDRVNFDMVLRIPKEGLDLKTLEDFIAVYKSSNSSFYNMVKPQ